jgi:hypothetical protein
VRVQHPRFDSKAGVVRLVLDEGKPVGALARDMVLTETAVPGMGQARVPIARTAGPA